jgi:hypothetical protein
MTHQDDPHRPNILKGSRTRETTPWAWIAGVAVVLVLGLIVWSAMKDNPNTASNDSPAISRPAPSTTGAAPRSDSAPMNPQGTQGQSR